MERPVLSQSEIVCTVTILAVQGDTLFSLYRERARRRPFAFRKSALGLAESAHVVERISDVRVLYGFVVTGRKAGSRMLWFLR